MRSASTALVLAVLGAPCAWGSAGQCQMEHPSAVTLNVENDLFAGTDREYTSGVKASWASGNLDDYLNDPCLPAILKRINRFDSFVGRGDYTGRNMVVSLAQQIFTPRDRTRTTLDPNDRPYAGWLYFGFAYNARHDFDMRTWELDLGMVGPQAYAKQTQDFIHDLRNLPKWKGWANQLADEPGLQLTYEHKNRVLFDIHEYFPRVDVIPHYGGAVGNVQTYLNAGAEIRFGYQLPDDFGTSELRPGGNNNAPLSVTDARSGLAAKGVHVFASFDARLVARNIFLDGNTFRSSPSVDKYPLVGDAALGFAWLWNRGKIAYTHYLRTKEFHQQSAAQEYGSISFTYVF
jgi:lipid A 3-O-deacylase